MSYTAEYEVGTKALLIGNSNLRPLLVTCTNIWLALFSGCCSCIWSS